MKSRRLIRAALLIFIVWGGWKLWHEVKDDPILSLLYFILGGAIVGLWVVKVVLPWIVEAFATSIFMSGGNVIPESEQQGREEEPDKEEATDMEKDKAP